MPAEGSKHVCFDLKKSASCSFAQCDLRIALIQCTFNNTEIEQETVPSPWVGCLQFFLSGERRDLRCFFIKTVLCILKADGGRRENSRYRSVEKDVDK